MSAPAPDAAVLAALRGLSAREAAALRGHLTGASIAEVADGLGVEHSSVKTYMKRIRAKLAHALGHAPTPGDIGYHGTLWLRAGDAEHDEASG